TSKGGPGWAAPGHVHAQDRPDARRYVCTIWYTWRPCLRQMCAVHDAHNGVRMVMARAIRRSAARLASPARRLSPGTLVNGPARFRPARGVGRRRADDGAHKASYAERRCALRWQLVTWGLGLPAALVAGLAWLIMFGSSHDAIASVVSSLMGL